MIQLQKYFEEIVIGSSGKKDMQAFLKSTQHKLIEIRKDNPFYDFCKDCHPHVLVQNCYRKKFSGYLFIIEKMSDDAYYWLCDECRLFDKLESRLTRAHCVQLHLNSIIQIKLEFKEIDGIFTKYDANDLKFKKSKLFFVETNFLLFRNFHQFFS